MARIAGVDLPRNKRIEVGLTYIYGIGPSTAMKILDAAGVSPDRRVQELNDEEVNKLRRIIETEPQFACLREIFLDSPEDIST